MAGNSSGAAGVVVVGFMVLLVAMCSAGGQRDSHLSPSGQVPVATPTPSPSESSLAETVDTRFVSARTLNQRSSPNGKIIGKLVGGESVVVYERRGDWARVSPEATSEKWVSSKLLCSGSGCYESTVNASRSRERSRPAHGNSLDGGCPCSGSRVCVGPRGGRYCITSGGNKRYGV